MDESALRDLGDVIARASNDYRSSQEQAQEQARRNIAETAKGEFLSILSQSQHDYTNAKLAYFKKEITAEQFYEITRDIVENVSRIGNEHLGSKVDDCGMVLSVWKDKVRDDMEDVLDKIHGYGKER